MIIKRKQTLPWDMLPTIFALAWPTMLEELLQTARAITTGTLQTVLYGLDNFCIFIESNCHRNSPFSFYYIPSVNSRGLPHSYALRNSR